MCVRASVCARVRAGPGKHARLLFINPEAHNISDRCFLGMFYLVLIIIKIKLYFKTVKFVALYVDFRYTNNRGPIFGSNNKLYLVLIIIKLYFNTVKSGATVLFTDVYKHY